VKALKKDIDKKKGIILRRYKNNIIELVIDRVLVRKNIRDTYSNKNRLGSKEKTVKIEG
jgi:hypothetical protein